jgi:hypothetical protein
MRGILEEEVPIKVCIAGMLEASNGAESPILGKQSKAGTLLHNASFCAQQKHKRRSLHR